MKRYRWRSASSFFLIYEFLLLSLSAEKSRTTREPRETAINVSSLAVPLRETERERVASSPSRALRKGSKPLFRGILAVADREAVKSRDSLFAGPSAPQEERRGEESSSSSASRVSYRRLYRCRYVVARRCTRVHVRYKPADLAPTLAHPAKPICLLITGAHTCQFIRRQKTTRERGCTWQWESRKARFRAINEHRWRINPPLYFSFFSSFLLRLPLYTCTLSVQLACRCHPLIARACLGLPLARGDSTGSPRTIAKSRFDAPPIALEIAHFSPKFDSPSFSIFFFPNRYYYFPLLSINYRAVSLPSLSVFDKRLNCSRGFRVTNFDAGSVNLA